MNQPDRDTWPWGGPSDDPELLRVRLTEVLDLHYTYGLEAYPHGAVNDILDALKGIKPSRYETPYQRTVRERKASFS